MKRFTATVHVKCFDGDYDHRLADFPAPALAQAPALAVLKAAGDLRGFFGLECTACTEIRTSATKPGREAA